MTVSKVKDYKKILQIFVDFMEKNRLGYHYNIGIDMVTEILITRGKTVVLEMKMGPCIVVLTQANPQNAAEINLFSALAQHLDVQYNT